MGRINRRRIISDTNIKKITVEEDKIAFYLDAYENFDQIAEPLQYILCAILGLPGMIGWILSVFSFKRIRDKKAVEINPLIAEKEEEIYKICEKGHGVSQVQY